MRPTPAKCQQLELRPDTTFAYAALTNLAADGTTRVYSQAAADLLVDTDGDD